jgi:hypothetical protein
MECAILDSLEQVIVLDVLILHAAHRETQRNTRVSGQMPDLNRLAKVQCPIVWDAGMPKILQVGEFQWGLETPKHGTKTEPTSVRDGLHMGHQPVDPAKWVSLSLQEASKLDNIENLQQA